MRRTVVGFGYAPQVVDYPRFAADDGPLQTACSAVGGLSSAVASNESK